MSRTPELKLKGRLLVIDDEKDVHYSFRRVLGDDYELLAARTGREGLSIFRDQKPDLVLTDVRMPEMDGMAVLKEIRKTDPKALVIMMTAYGTTQTAIEAIKAGAYDYVLKPFDIQKIKQLIQDAMRSSESMKSVVSYQPLLSREDHAQGIIGKSDAMQAVYKEIGRVAAKNIPVLIMGETGTGKELAARAIYHHSDRNGRKFLAINCAAIPELLLESELFGHERGAFTGAFTRKIGKFEVCDSGTIFLDEIGELSPATQSKLLRVLQEKEIERLGGSAPISVDVRVIAATNRDLRAMIRAGTFREDLFYRLNVVAVTMPPLRDRREDISLLVEYFVERFVADYGGKTTVSESAMKLLENYDWPGNVRELENSLKNSLVRVKGGVLMPADLRLGEGSDNGAIAGKSEGRAAGSSIAGSGARGLGSSSGNAPSASARDLDGLMAHVFEEVRRLRAAGKDDDAFDLVERCLVREALVHVSGNQVQAAKILGITRSTLRKRMAKYGFKLKMDIEAKELQ
jgi:DNA-binding NtrC family response regulator